MSQKPLSVLHSKFGRTTTLAASGDENLRRLALAALMAQTNSRLGWNQTRVNRLLKYRQDKSALVAAAAQFTFPPDQILN